MRATHSPRTSSRTASRCTPTASKTLRRSKSAEATADPAPPASSARSLVALRTVMPYLL
ncbi:MAG: hypothetical protein AVDCRST_MAG30-4248 [uncultured Solirubrobacteraceae bacterium]|uniref:Uncharacterized protein n=1 Tax=uncultured Solirubrobacteraceae bacterium TaxID=1162706 RepID=A0A6J4TZT2_9ACTN|nr:MAG: hypothetical protein AVDCRST_MAG30-4248 [uncultured Solirubrobacteraceae bacterium]